MAYKITEDCVLCGVCVTVCPNEAITEGDPIYILDPEKCTECVPVHPVSQCEDVCPTMACVKDPDRKESKEELEAKYKKLKG